MPLKPATLSKRGYLANIKTLPPLIYPFQYNPVRITDNKQVTLGKKSPTSGKPDAAIVGRDAEDQGTQLTKAGLHRLESEGDRTIGFQLIIDGRDQRPGEPARRRNEGGDILADLAILRSFIYPKTENFQDLLNAMAPKPSGQGVEKWFKEPPTALLILGDLVVEGFITSLNISETLFNENMDPVRAEVDISITEKVDSFSFVADAVKRISRTAYYTAYEDKGKVSL